MFDRKTSDGSSFWSLSARNSVTSMFEGMDNAEVGDDNSENESPRKMLQKKRSSLAHKPDPSMLVLESMERRNSQAQQTVHEFQKVNIGDDC